MLSVLWHFPASQSWFSFTWVRKWKSFGLIILFLFIYRDLVLVLLNTNHQNWELFIEKRETSIRKIQTKIKGSIFIYLPLNLIWAINWNNYVSASILQSLNLSFPLFLNPSIIQSSIQLPCDNQLNAPSFLAWHLKWRHQGAWSTCAWIPNTYCPSPSIMPHLKSS